MGQLRVGMVGYAFMGAAHSQAWRTVNRAFDLPLSARMSVVCGRRRGEASPLRPRQLGWDEHTTDWRSLIARDDIDLIDICTPGDTHAEIALAALAAGKHVLCEKPLANTVAEAREMAAAAAQAQTQGVRAMCGFNYRRVPGRGADAQAHRGRPARHDPARPGGVPAGLDRRPGVPAGLAAAQGHGRLRCAGRHRRAHRRPDAVRDRPADHRGERADRDVRQGAPAAGRVDRPGGVRPTATAPARSPWTTRRCSWPGWTAARSPPTRRPASPPAARTGCGWRSTARSARWRSTSSG